MLRPAIGRAQWLGANGWRTRGRPVVRCGHDRFFAEGMLLRLRVRTSSVSRSTTRMMRLFVSAT